MIHQTPARVLVALLLAGAVVLTACDEIDIIKLNAYLSNAKAQAKLAARYAHGNGVPKDLAESVRWYRKAAGRGAPEADYGLAGLYARGGEGLPQDQAEAVRFYRMAAEQGYPYAAYDLGLCYLRGVGVERDLAEAHVWIHLAGLYGLRYAFRTLKDIEGELDAEQIARARERAREIYRDR